MRWLVIVTIIGVGVIIGLQLLALNVIHIAPLEAVP